MDPSDVKRFDSSHIPKVDLYGDPASPKSESGLEVVSINNIRKRQSCSPTSSLDMELPDNRWKRRRSSILNAIRELEGSPTKESSIQRSVSKKTMKMNIQLMKGEIPQVYSDLLLRFKVVDVFLKCNYPRVMNIKDINNILLLTDHHLSFLEEHVASIMYLYSYSKEKEDAYELGRVVPRSPIDISFLTLQLPHVKSHLSTQNLYGLSSTRNLNHLFALMDQEQQEDDLHLRYDQLTRNVRCYIEDKYKDYLKNTKLKPCKSGRIMSFTMVELGEMPKASLPLPLKYVVLTPDDVLRAFQQDVDKAIDENQLVPSTADFKQRNEHGFDFDLDEV